MDYLPITALVDNVMNPTFVYHVALFRTICVRENLQIVHNHQATSRFRHECFVQAKSIRVNVGFVYTDHPLFGFTDAASVPSNKDVKIFMSTVATAIGAPHTC